MPFQAMQFKPQTAAQSDGVAQGYAAMGALIKGSMDDVAQYKKLKSLSPELAAQLGTNIAKMHMAQADASTEGDLRHANISRTQAQAGLAHAQLHSMPLTDAIRAQQSMQQGSRFGGAYQMAKALRQMPAPTRAAWMAQHQKAYANMVNELGNQQKTPSLVTEALYHSIYPGANAPQQQAQPGIPPQAQPGMQQQAPVQNGQNPLQQAIMQHLLPQTQQVGMPPSAGGGLQPAATSPLGAVPSQVSPQVQAPAPTQAAAPDVSFQPGTPAQTAVLQRASQMAANKELVTPQTRRQLEGGIQIDQIMNSPQFNDEAQNASQFAGLVGRVGLAKAKLSQTNPKALEDYLSFTNHYLPLIGNRIRTVDGMGATDAQTALLHSMFSKTMLSMSSNPKQFMTQLHALRKTLAQVTASVQKSAQPLFPVQRIGSTRPAAAPQKTAGYQTTFTSEPEYHKYVSTLTHPQRIELARQLKGGR